MKVWFITGTSRGFGRVWADAAMKRGDKVAATARNTETLKELQQQYGDSILPIQLDVTDREADFAAVKQAFEHFGRLDVVINNAGYGHFGMIEEVTESEARAQIETNVFGALWVTQAAIPYLRQQGSGHIIQVSSIGGVAAFAGLGLYHASKWALEGFSEALSQELAPFGIKVTIIEPGGFDTDWGGASSKHSQANPAYDKVREARAQGWSKVTRGKPEATGEVVLKLVDSPEPPLRILFGKFASDYVKTLYPARLEVWSEWEALARSGWRMTLQAK